jgi:hypothetical protein
MAENNKLFIEKLKDLATEMTHDIYWCEKAHIVQEAVERLEGLEALLTERGEHD